MSSQDSLLDWPEGIERTPPGERENTTKFSSNFSRSKKDLRKEFDRMGADEWRIEDVSGSHGDPGVIVRWKMDGEEYAAACDAYENKKDNLREAYLWVHETRMRSDRPVETAEDDFAAAKLPSGDATPAPEVPPNVVLEVSPNASDETVKEAYREKAKSAHADQGGSNEQMKRLNRAKEAMLSDGGGS